MEAPNKTIISLSTKGDKGKISLQQAFESSKFFSLQNTYYTKLPDVFEFSGEFSEEDWLYFSIKIFALYSTVFDLTAITNFVSGKCLINPDNYMEKEYFEYNRFFNNKLRYRRKKKRTIQVEIRKATTPFYAKEAYYSYKRRVIIFPAEVKTFPEDYFIQCFSLEIIAPGLETLQKNTFIKCVSIILDAPKLKSLDKDAFYGSRSIKIKKNQLMEIRPNTFYKMNTEIDLQSIEKIGDKAFFGGSLGLYFLKPKKLLSIGFLAFANCSFIFLDLEQCTNLTSIPEKSFINIPRCCLILPKSIETIEKKAFYNTFFDRTVFDFSEIINFGPQAFKKTNIKELNLNSVQTISQESFAKCEELTEVKFGCNLKKIALNAFEGSYKINRFIKKYSKTESDISNAVFLKFLNNYCKKHQRLYKRENIYEVNEKDKPSECIYTILKYDEYEKNPENYILKSFEIIPNEKTNH